MLLQDGLGSAGLRRVQGLERGQLPLVAVFGLAHAACARRPSRGAQQGLDQHNHCGCMARWRLGMVASGAEGRPPPPPPNPTPAYLLGLCGNTLQPPTAGSMGSMPRKSHMPNRRKTRGKRGKPGNSRGKRGGGALPPILPTSTPIFPPFPEVPLVAWCLARAWPAIQGLG